MTAKYAWREIEHHYLGVDPGPSTGIALLTALEGRVVRWAAMQVNGSFAEYLMNTLARDFSPELVAVEAFIPSNRAGTAGADADLTRALVADTARLDLKYVIRRAADVKTWASDKRLEKTGFPMGPKFRDARDAGRHVLHAAVTACAVRDPLA